MLYSQVSCILAAEAEAKKQLEEDRRKKIEIEKKQKLQQMASKRKSQKKKVVESKPTDSSTFSLFGKGVSTEQKEVVPALIETPKTTQHEVQSTPNKDISSKNKLFDWKAPKWSQDKSNPKAQVQQKEEESSKLGRVTLTSQRRIRMMSCMIIRKHQSLVVFGSLSSLAMLRFYSVV